MMANNQGSTSLAQTRERPLTPFRGLGPTTPAAFFSESPWESMRRMQEDMDRLFRQFLGGTMDFGAAAGIPQEMWSPRIDVSETDRECLVEAELPGVKPDDIDVQIRDDQLVIRAQMQEEKTEDKRRFFHRERQVGFCERVLPLPQNIDEEKISCEFNHGVLVCHLPKTAQAAVAGRRIPVGTASQSAAPSQPER